MNYEAEFTDFYLFTGEDNEPTDENFGFQEIPFPEDPPKDGEVLIQNKYLSLDPALVS